MIDPDKQLPQLRERLLLLCAMLAQSPDSASETSLTRQIEQTALDIGFVCAVDLLNNGWRPDQRLAAELQTRLASSPVACMAA